MQNTDSTDFRSLGLSSRLLSVINDIGFSKLTSIQARSIPLLLSGADVVGQSKTGSGKTAAFALPMLEKIQLPGRRLQGLILCPTRELCTQVAREIRSLGRNHPGLAVLVLCGGQPLYPQTVSLQKGVHIVVGTPGRILDHLKRESLSLKSLTHLVLDEADRMLDMGFQDDMEAILSVAPSSRQTALFSATFPSSIKELSERFQRQAVHVSIENNEKAKIRQVLYEIAHEKKEALLQTVLHQIQPESAIIFCNLKVRASELASSLAQNGASIGCLHGDLLQPDRDRVMAQFRNRSIRILVATDVAARGIDVADLDLVVNFDMPGKPETYVHRIGRTGRAGKSGLAISFVTAKEAFKCEAIENLTGKCFEREKSDLLPQEQMPRLKASAQMSTLYISGGRKDKLRPGDILGALTGEAGGLSGENIGKIEIHDRFAYVAVSRQIAQLACERLRQGRIKGRKFNIELVN